MKRFLLLFLSLCFTTVNRPLFPSEENSNLLESDNLKSAISYKNKKNTSNLAFVESSQFMENEQAFFQYNVGVGFLYFSGVRGTLSLQPGEDMNPYNYTPLQGRLSSNKSPLYEAILGYRFTNWIKLALSYQYQGGIVVSSNQSPAVAPSTGGVARSNTFSQFTSNLSLNGLFAKVYFELPQTLLWKEISFTPYLALGVGPAWQSWTRTRINRSFTQDSTALYFSDPQPLTQKISANAAWMADLGLKIKEQNLSTDFLVTLGCKYNQWGQARSMGKMTQQDSLKIALADPVRIRTLYSFAPYFGVQWNFPTTYLYYPKHRVNGRIPDTFRPYFATTSEFTPRKNSFAQFNVGPNFLYSSNVRGNLSGLPKGNFSSWNNVPLKRRLSQNKVPMIEILWGYRFSKFIHTALSFQHAAGMTVQTKMLNATGANGATATTNYSQLQANLELDSIMGKFYLESPGALIWKSLATIPYIAVGAGPSWQSWTNIQVNRTNRDTVGFVNEPQLLRQKIVANASYMVDAGFKLKNLDPENNFSVTMGCRYNQWGQIRNIGLITQQNSLRKGLTNPFRAKILYSFTPYLAAQWDFPCKCESRALHKLRGRPVNSSRPFWTSMADLQDKRSPFTQLNTGLGFLYFSNIRGNLTAQPFTYQTFFVPQFLRGGVSYNRTPLFEYIVGTRLSHCFKVALSYQHQGGVNFRTQALQNSVSRPNQYLQFTADLALDAIMAKVYFDLPYGLVYKWLCTTPYLALGVGPGWQTWSSIEVQFNADLGNPDTFTNNPMYLRQKISANAVWMADLGFKTQCLYQGNSFSFLTGCKYVQWGQARSMGKVSDQTHNKLGLWKPISIQTVYSFAPYIGMQWNF